jgi:hypothetical protein
MRLLNALRGRLFGEPDDHEATDMSASEPEAVHEATPFQDAVPGRQERAASRILEDESLRGDLTDDEFQPLLDWALAQTDRAAAATARLEDEAADAFIDAAVSAVREALRAAQDVIAAHAERRTDDRREALDAVSQVWKPSLVGGDDTDLPHTLWRPLQQLADRLDAEPELPGAEVATAVVAALTLSPAPVPATEMPAGDEESVS